MAQTPRKAHGNGFFETENGITIANRTKLPPEANTSEREYIYIGNRFKGALK